MKELNIKDEFDAETIKTADNKPQRIKVVPDIIMPAIAQLPPGGLDFLDMEPRITLIQKLKKAIAANEDSILLNDADHAELVKAMKGQRYLIADLHIFNYVKSIINLPDAIVEVKNNKKTIGNKTA